jgi:hypothetical protein
MKVRHFIWLLAAAAILFTAPAPRAAGVVILTVDHHGPFNNTDHFATIQEAIDKAHSNLSVAPTNTNSYSISVKADTTAYSGSFTLKDSSVSITGEKTAGTFLTGSVSPLITVNNISSVTISNFTFQTGVTVGISVTNSHPIITNNVFTMEANATAVQIQGSSADIRNNTFYLNKTAISTDSNILITNNIFSNNTKAISAPSVSLTQASYNDYFPKESKGDVTLDTHSIPNTQVLNSDPSFVNPVVNTGDFHLQAGSPCLDSGNPNYPNSFNAFDMGAYGGPNADIGPPTVTNLTASITPDPAITPPATITLNWDQNSSAAVTAYRVYYGTSFGTYTSSLASEGKSPIPVLGRANTSAALTFTAFPPTASQPAAPTLNQIIPLNQSLKLIWTSVPGATQYLVYFQPNSTLDPSNLPTPTVVDAVTTAVDASTNSYAIPNLVNSTHYFVAVAARTQTTIFATVTAVLDSSVAPRQGSANESAFSNVVSQNLGQTQDSAISNIINDFPEPISANPDLKGGGCFIATAAFGFYSAPQVQVLREFRDRYLLTNAPGRAFVSWYYHYGPYGARFINEHPWLKPPVRLALLPLIALSMVLIHTSPLAKIAIMLFAIVASAYLFQRRQKRMLLLSGGAH